MSLQTQLLELQKVIESIKEIVESQKITIQILQNQVDTLETKYVIHQSQPPIPIVNECDRDDSDDYRYMCWCCGLYVKDFEKHRCDGR
jgi:hypothetical protein